MKRQSGQTMIILVFFVVTALAVVVAAIFIMSASLTATADLENGMEVKQLADSGAEEALIRLERDPSFSGESYTVGDTSISITISGSTTYTIDVTATSSNNFVRKVEVLANYNNNVLTVSSWKEKI